MINQICWLIRHYHVYYMHVIFTIDHIHKNDMKVKKRVSLSKPLLKEGIKREIKMSPSK